MLHWDRDSAMIAERIGQARTPFKIILKTADDPILLPMWLDHYLSFMPPEGVVIADNMSTHPDVLAAYAQLPEGVTVFRYTDQPAHGFHNVIHDRIAYAALYDALRRSCRHSALVDTDEFLHVADQSGWKADHGAVMSVLDAHPVSAVPMVWLQTIRGSADSAYIGTDHKILASGISWGKPFVPSDFRSEGFLIHNVQFPYHLFAGEIDARLFLLHLVEFSPEQRLASNRRKLMARRFVTPDASYAQIAAMDTSKSSDPTVVRLVQEMQEQLLRRHSEPYAGLPSHCLRFAPGGVMEFADASMANRLQSFIEGAQPIFRKRYEMHGPAKWMPEKDNTVMKPHMTDAEVLLFRKHLTGCRFLLEFGCGGSTVFAAQQDIPAVTSIDSDKAWLKKVAAAPEVASIRFTPVFIDIGKTGDWGVPADMSSARKWPPYYNSVWETLPTTPDVVLVDGRFRVACTLASLLHCPATTRFIIHDFWDRSHYAPVLEFLDCMDRVDNIGIFSPKVDLDFRRLGAVLSQHVLDYR